MRLLICLFTMALLLVGTPAAAMESWENNLIIDLPIGNDIITSDWNELECLATNIYHEARSESSLGQELVAQVTVNRMNHTSFPDTVCGVVRQSRQFSWTHDGKSDQITDRAAYEKAYIIAIEYLHLKKTAKVKHANVLLNYHADWVAPNWDNLTIALAVGSHIFYKRG